MGLENKDELRLKSFLDQYQKRIGDNKKDLDRTIDAAVDSNAFNKEAAKTVSEGLNAIQRISKKPLKERVEVLVKLIEAYPSVLDGEALYHMTLGIVMGVIGGRHGIPPELKKILEIQ